MQTYGIERERFIVNASGRIVPAIGELLPRVHDLARAKGVSTDLFSHELFAGQIEDRTPPCKTPQEIAGALELNDAIMNVAAHQLGYTLECSEIVDDARFTSLEVNPFDARHQAIWQAIPLERKIAASVVAAVHVHLSVTEEEAVELLNLCRPEVIEKLINIGDHSGRRRITVYKVMAQTEGAPPRFSSYANLMEYIDSKGGEKNVWDLVRYKPSTKTVEFRMFGATRDIHEVLGYVEACKAVFCDAVAARV